MVLSPFMSCIQNHSPNIIMWEDFNKLLYPNYMLKSLSIYLQMRALQIGKYRPHIQHRANVFWNQCAIYLITALWCSVFTCWIICCYAELEYLNYYLWYTVDIIFAPYTNSMHAWYDFKSCINKDSFMHLEI